MCSDENFTCLFFENILRNFLQKFLTIVKHLDLTKVQKIHQMLQETLQSWTWGNHLFVYWLFGKKQCQSWNDQRLTHSFIFLTFNWPKIIIIVHLISLTHLRPWWPIAWFLIKFFININCFDISWGTRWRTAFDMKIFIKLFVLLL